VVFSFILQGPIEVAAAIGLNRATGCYRTALQPNHSGLSCPTLGHTVAYILKREKKIQVVRMLVEGCSIRSIERVTRVHRDTICRLLVRVGRHCASLHDQHVQNVDCDYVQCDEIWAYVGKKQRRMRDGDNGDFGDTYTFVGMDQDSKLVISYLVGKRDSGHTHAFMEDLAARTTGRVQITTDAWGPYPDAVMDNFNGRSAYGQVVKAYGGGTTDQVHRYSPPGLVTVRRCGMWGAPRHRYISTSHVERQNLTMRMQMRRFTRLTNAFSKKLDNLRAAVALHFAWYNFVRVHRSLGMTPAMMAGISPSIWTMNDLIPE